MSFGVWAGIFSALIVVLAFSGFAIYWWGIRKSFSALLVNDGTPSANTMLLAGKTFTLSFRGSHVPSADWSYSTDNGVTYTTIQSAASGPVAWTVPSDAFSQQVFLRVSHGGVSLTSARLQVAPSLHMKTGQSPNTHLVVNAETVILWEGICELLTSENVKLQYGDGALFTDVGRHEYTVSVEKKAVVWGVDSSLANQSHYLRIITTDLVSQGYPGEVSAISDFAVGFDEGVNSGATSAGGVFSTFNLFATRNLSSDYINSDSYILFGQTIYGQFALSAGGTLGAYKVYYSFNDETFKEANFENVASNVFALVIPSKESLGGFDGTLSVKLEQTNTNTSPLPSIRVDGINVTARMHVPPNSVTQIGRDLYFSISTQAFDPSDETLQYSWYVRFPPALGRTLVPPNNVDTTQARDGVLSFHVTLDSDQCIDQFYAYHEDTKNGVADCVRTNLVKKNCLNLRASKPTHPTHVSDTYTTATLSTNCDE